MTNIWGFLNQTMTVSLVAAILLIVKQVLNDKLSPRWQYGIWSILLLRMLLPVNVKKMVFLPFSYWIEILKASIEMKLDSAYTNVYEPVELSSMIPSLKMKPESITDWIFVVYVAGIIICLMRYIFVFISLRWKLRKGNTISIQKICERYGLKSCKTVVVNGLHTAFVCAGLKPVLVLPDEKNLDEKVILHELLHLKYHDECQTVLWCIFKCFHWCNPFLWYVFKRIENDMESLCDQRVLERLEGEERRAYGIVLLQMANEKYARVPGTSSISNGGANIKRRIEAIVRFKKYPKGMALVSVCIGIVFLFPVFVGTSLAYNADVLQPRNEAELRDGMALARLERCTTVAGAIDTYAKGLMYNRGIYIAIASPMDKHEELAEHMYTRVNHLDQDFLYDSGEEFEYLKSNEYIIVNLQEVGKDEYIAFLMFPTFIYEETETKIGSIVLAVRVWYEDAWVVEEVAERQILFGNYLDIQYDERYKDLYVEKIYEHHAETGNVVVRVSNEALIDNWVASELNFFGMGSYSSDLKTDAVFQYVIMNETVEYTYEADSNGNVPTTSFGIVYAGLESTKQVEEVPIQQMAPDSSQSGASTGGGLPYGYGWVNQSIQGDNREDRTVRSGGGTYTMYDAKDISIVYPEYYLVRVFWNGKQVEEIILE